MSPSFPFTFFLTERTYFLDKFRLSFAPFFNSDSVKFTCPTDSSNAWCVIPFKVLAGLHSLLARRGAIVGLSPPAMTKQATAPPGTHQTLPTLPERPFQA